MKNAQVGSAPKQDIERRLLILELLRLRREADLARLEARAAKIECMLHRLRLGHELRSFSASRASRSERLEKSSNVPNRFPDSELASGPPELGSEIVMAPKVTRADGSATGLSGEEGRGVTKDFVAKDSVTGGAEHDRLVQNPSQVSTMGGGKLENERDQGSSFTMPISSVSRGGHPTEREPSSFDSDLGWGASLSEGSSNRSPVEVNANTDRNDGSGGDRGSGTQGGERPSAWSRWWRSLGQNKKISSRLETTRSGTRRRAMFVSGFIHLALLMALGFAGIKLRQPKKQVQLTASVASSEMALLESVSMEISEPSFDSEAFQQPELKISPESDAELGSPALLFDGGGVETEPLLFRETAVATASAARLQQTSSAENIEFCGVKGGGSHFVYLVDSSKSMGKAFEIARAELLRSIQNLRPEQRFYVIFFDADSDYMRITDRATNESSSVTATERAKLAVADWAMDVKMNAGRAPYEPLRFALSLKPDVIFLLSDGEFPEGIGAFLEKENRIENLFGERRPGSIVHTISFHSQHGEHRMRQIAQQNGGRYRYVPRP